MAMVMVEPRLAILQATGIDGLAVMEMPISLSKRMGTAVQELQ